jgi:uncharacterized protein (DUF1778 family)
MTKRRNYEDVGIIELSGDEDRLITGMIAEADTEIDETGVSFRWSKEQLAVVKQAADQMGVPYQAFMKMSAYERALDLLKDVQTATKSDDDG